MAGFLTHEEWDKQFEKAIDGSVDATKAKVEGKGLLKRVIAQARGLNNGNNTQ